MAETDIPSIRIRADACKQDSLCVQLCPTRGFKPRAGDVPAVEHTEECVLCGQCVAGCPSNAIEHSGFGPERLQRIDRSLRPDPAVALALLSQRRSVRVYKPEPPPRQLLDEVLRVAGYAPGSPQRGEAANGVTCRTLVRFLAGSPGQSAAGAQVAPDAGAQVAPDAGALRGSQSLRGVWGGPHSN